MGIVDWICVCVCVYVCVFVCMHGCVNLCMHECFAAVLKNVFFFWGANLGVVVVVEGGYYRINIFYNPNRTYLWYTLLAMNEILTDISTTH